MAYGRGYVGSSNIQTSAANQDIIPSAPYRYNLYKFQFINDQDCHVLINREEIPLFIRAGQGFEIDINDSPIFAFRIVESGIKFNWAGAYA